MTNEKLNPLFRNQQGTAGIGGLLIVASVLATWLVVGLVMWNAYLTPQVREPEHCQVLCRQLPTQHSKS